MWSWSKSKHDRVSRSESSLARNPELQIRSVMNDPALRRLMGLDQSPPVAAVTAPTITERPRRPFGRRQLLEAAAA